MGGSIDSSKWKPRKLGGTPSRSFIRYLSLAVLGVASLIGVAYEYVFIYIILYFIYFFLFHKS